MISHPQVTPSHCYHILHFMWTPCGLDLHESVVILHNSDWGKKKKKVSERRTDKNTQEKLFPAPEESRNKNKHVLNSVCSLGSVVMCMPVVENLSCHAPVSRHWKYLIYQLTSGRKNTITIIPVHSGRAPIYICNHMIRSNSNSDHVFFGCCCCSVVKVTQNLNVFSRRCGAVSEASVVACCFSPCGQMFMTGCTYGDLKLWDVDVSLLHAEKDAHDLGVACCRFASQFTVGEFVAFKVALHSVFTPHRCLFLLLFIYLVGWCGDCSVLGE